MLGTEFGGMNEVMADLYADTGDARWLDLSYRFEHKAVLDPLKRGEDPLDGLHGNTQVPEADRIGGALRVRREPSDDLPRRRSSGDASSTTTPSRPAVTARTSTSASPTALAASPTAAPPRRATSTTC